MKKENNEVVLCIYDENGVSINEKILEIFRKYVMSTLRNSDF